MRGGGWIWWDISGHIGDFKVEEVSLALSDASETPSGRESWVEGRGPGGGVGMSTITGDNKEEWWVDWDNGVVEQDVGFYVILVLMVIGADGHWSGWSNPATQELVHLVPSQV